MGLLSTVQFCSGNFAEYRSWGTCSWSSETRRPHELWKSLPHRRTIVIEPVFVGNWNHLYQATYNYEFNITQILEGNPNLGLLLYYFVSLTYSNFPFTPFFSADMTWRAQVPASTEVKVLESAEFQKLHAQWSSHLLRPSPRRNLINERKLKLWSLSSSLNVIW